GPVLRQPGDAAAAVRHLHVLRATHRALVRARLQGAPAAAGEEVSMATVLETPAGQTPAPAAAPEHPAPSAAAEYVLRFGRLDRALHTLLMRSCRALAAAPV